MIIICSCGVLREVSVDTLRVAKCETIIIAKNLCPICKSSHGREYEPEPSQTTVKQAHFTIIDEYGSKGTGGL